MHNYKFVVVIQVRMGSTRLPGKALLPLNNIPMIRHIIRRCKASMANEVVIATTQNKEDDVFNKIAKSEGIKIYHGSENDVLDRFYNAAGMASADYVIRVTGDQPFMDYKVIDDFIRFVKQYNKQNNYELDFLGNKGYPDGIDIDVVNIKALRRACNEATEKSDREHVMPYIYHNPEKFNIKYMECPYGDLSKERWTCDEKLDYEFVNFINRELYKKNNFFGIKEVLEFLKKNPELRKMNSNIEKNEGYLKSLYYDNDLKKSYEMLQEAKKYIPALSQTLSKAPKYYPQGFAPIYLESGNGSWVKCVDGHTYLDFVCGLGPITLGYNNKAVNDAVIAQVKKGPVFTLPHRVELELTKELIKIIPGAEMVRFAKNGSDVTGAAVKLARAYTNREGIAYAGGYHGAQDWYCITTPINFGIPKFNAELIHKFEWNNINSLKQIFKDHPNQIAAVIFEVPAVDPLPGFLDAMKSVAHKNGAVIILDDVVTGFRYALGGASEYYNFKADLIAAGKGVANGYTLSILAGKKEIMDMLQDKCFLSMTSLGNAVDITAALATIKEMKKKKYHQHIKKVGTQFREGFAKLTKKHNVNVEILGNFARTVLKFKNWDNVEDNKVKTLFFQEMLRNKVLCMASPFFMSLSHGKKEIDFALNACDKALAVVAKAYKQKSTDGYLIVPELGSAFTRGSGSR